MKINDNIEDIFKGVRHTLVRSELAPQRVSKLEFSSRDVSEGALFFCVPGTVVDGHNFAADALERGAAALVVDHELNINAAQFVVDDVRLALALCSANYYCNPSDNLKIVGITGTNGKTTTAFLVEHLVQYVGKRAGLIGTVECHFDGRIIPSEHTTPESRDFQELLAKMVEAKVDVCASEISSHALALDRVAGTHFAVAAFSNLTQDHLDYHKTMEEYFAAKARLFVDYDSDNCVINIDSEPGKKLADLCKKAGRKLIRVGSAKDCEVRFIDAQFGSHSTHIDIEANKEWLHIELPLIGQFNVENALLVFGIGLALGLSNSEIIEACASAPQVPGRLERVIGSKGSVPSFSVLVDYAHTPDSVSKAISAVSAVTNGRVICVFGCGGDRDSSKRPKMGAAALAADYAILTSDNPRTEDPQAIIDQVLEGMKGAEDSYSVIADRKEAIEFAVSMAKPGDLVLIAGKGHEDYQIIGTEKHHFDDREVAALAIEEMKDV